MKIIHNAEKVEVNRRDAEDEFEMLKEKILDLKTRSDEIEV